MVPRNNITLYVIWVFTETFSKSCINKDKPCCQRKFSAPICNMNLVKDETKRAFEGLFMSLVKHLGIYSLKQFYESLSKYFS